MRVLMIDDETVACSTVEKILAGSGNSLECTGSWEIALQEIKNQSVDLVITDIGLPRMEGFQLAHTINVRKPNLPIIMMSEFIDDDIIERAAQEGITKLLRKPVVPRELQDAVRACTKTPA